MIPRLRHIADARLVSLRLATGPMALSTDSPTSQAVATSHWKVVAWSVLVVVSAVLFTWRAVLDSEPGRLDFVLVYSASRAWVTGANPYDVADIAQVWIDAGGPMDRSPTSRVFPHLIYPPPTLLMLAPFGVLPWAWAEPVWVAANVMFLGVAIWAIASLAGFRWRQHRTWLFLAMALAFMPVHTTFRHGQTPLYPFAFMAVGLWLSRAAGQWAPGLLQGAATLIKPQLGLPFIALEFVRGRFRAVGWALAALAICCFLSVLPFLWKNIDWWSAWQGNLHAVTSPGNQLDPTPANPWRYQMINLHVPLHGFIGNRTVVGALVVAIVVLLGGAFFFHPLRQWKWIRPPLLMSASMVAVLSLLFIYHRYYDAVLLLFPLAWAVGRLGNRRDDRPGWLMLALLLPFMVNSASAMYWLDYSGRMPAWLTGSAFWRVAIIPHQGWAVLLMGVLLAWVRITQNSARLDQKLK